MNTSSHLALIAVLTGIALSFGNDSATAQAKKQKRSPDAALFTKLDKNKDGKLTRNEMSESQLKSFQRLLRVGDIDKNGELSRAEFLKALAVPKTQPKQPSPKRKAQPGNPQQIFRNLDRNKDGKLELTEVSEDLRPRLKPIFDRADKTSLTRAEFGRIFRQIQQQQNRQRLQNRARQLFTQFDTNKDGKLGVEEAPRQRKQFVRNLLKQGKKAENEFLTREQAVPLILRALQANQQRTNRRVVEFLRRFDKNKDRRISKEEAPERLQQQFNRLDANKNGYLDYLEIARIGTNQARKRPDAKKKSAKKKSDRRKKKNTKGKNERSLETKNAEKRRFDKE